MNQKTIERVPTCGENDVDLLIARSPRRAVDRPASTAPQPVDAAQAVPELTIQSVTEKIKAWFPDRAGQARFFAADLFGAPIRAIDEFEAEELRKSGAQPTDTTKDSK